MRRYTMIPLAFALLMAAGCSTLCDETAPVQAVPFAAPNPCAAAANPCAPMAAQPFSIQGPSGAYSLGAPTAVRVTTGPMSYVRSGLAIPANTALCLTTGIAKGVVLLGETVHCVVNSLVPPEPAPTFTPMYTPQAPQAPAGTWSFTPAPAPAAASPCR